MKTTTNPEDLVQVKRDGHRYIVIDIPTGRQVGKRYQQRSAAYKKETELLRQYRKAGRLID